MDESLDPAPAEAGAAAEIAAEKKLLEENFGLSESAATAAAEDRILGVAPAESSYEVELERIAKAQATEPDGPGKH